MASAERSIYKILDRGTESLTPLTNQPPLTRTAIMEFTVTFTRQGYICAVVHNTADTAQESIDIATLYVTGKWDAVRAEPTATVEFV